MHEMVIWQRVEGALVFVATSALFLFQNDGFIWSAAVLALFAPDLSFLGYAFGSRIGPTGCNVIQIYAFRAVFLALGVAIDSVTLAQLGALWLAHSDFDRLLGYGLKSWDGFKFTHLGMIRPEPAKRSRS